jgi:hypothetical protein
MLFYRFDAGPGDGLRFQIGDALAYDGGIGHELYAIPGEDFCFALDLEALRDFEPSYRADLTLTQGYAAVRAQASLDLESSSAGATLTLNPCLPVPTEAPAGPHHLRLRVVDSVTGRALPLLEADNLYWGETLVFALVHVGGER